MCLLFLPLLCMGQMSQRVTNLAGFDLASSGVIVTVSIGEPAVTTLATSSLSVTQGFLQPEILPCKDLRFNYYPNPAKDDITIEAFGCEAQIESLEIIDMWGRLVRTAEAKKNSKVDLTGLSQGVYVIRVLLSNSAINNITIVKLNH